MVAIHASSTAFSLPRALFDSLVEPVLVFSPAGRLQFANQAALRQLACEPGMGLADLEQVFSSGLLDWMRNCLAAGAVVAQPAHWPQGGPGLPVFTPLDDRHWVLCLPLEDVVPLRSRESAPVLDVGDEALRELHGMLWAAPFPAALQDEGFRLIDVNQAYLDLTGRSRQELIGRDPMELLPEEDQAAARQEREQLQRDPRRMPCPALQEQRVVDAQGQLRWVRCARYLTLTQDGRRLQLLLMQETTAEHAAREQAERFSRELDQWFDLSPLGMALFDESGLVLRSNQAFGQLVGGAPVELRDASEAVRALLHWDDGRLAFPLETGGTWVTLEGALPRPEASPRWVRALLRCYEARGGQRRIMCMLEDRTAEEERDIAQLQLGALVDTAGVGLATLRGPAGADALELAPAPAPAPTSVSTSASASASASASTQGAMPVAAAPGRAPSARATLHQSVRREWVLPASLPEYERLQRALKVAQRCEVRYAIVHPELGPRWLVTRVEPGRLASGRPTTSVVTLDVTEQQQAQERAEQLLAELSTILESSPAGIASMRGYTLMHCNRRFERMLRLGAGAGVGSDIRALLATRTNSLVTPSSLNDSLDQGVLYEAELEVAADDGALHWYALTIRRTGPGSETPQAIAVLSEITRLKSQQVQLESLAHEREQMAQVLGQQADRTRAVLDSVLVGIVTVNHAGVISWLNRSARRMFGGDLGDFLGQPIDAVATQDEYHPFRHSLELFDQLRDGEAVKFECRVQGRDGRTFWVVGNAVATLSLDGSRELIYALLDIEQRRQAEARIAQARASLQRIIEAAPMAIALFDAASLEVQQINRVAAEWVGLAAEAAVGRTPEQLFAQPVAAQMRNDLLAVQLQPGSTTQREYRFAQGAGTLHTWEARFLVLARSGDRVDQVLLVASDVTAQRAAQQAELAAAIAQREMLVQEVHHRIKNNLQGVAGLMQQVAARRPEVQPIIAEVVGQVQAIAQVYGLQVGGVGPLKLASVAEAIVQSVQRTFGRSIRWAAWSPSGQPEPAPLWTLPEAEAIPIALTLNELLTNAIKHSPALAEVGCELHSLADGARIEITNPGRLPEGFRIDNRPATVSGLGLVRALLPRRHAALEIDQQGDRVVAAVTLRAPLLTALAPPALSRAEQQAGPAAALLPAGALN
ncbi:MAG TPA: PAS domain S-box protein [Burkholderiaceae bacterium]|jgi:hypothetical protein|nr:PAS domain S-box protein [Burkholderiaceae bacterium]